MTTQMPNTKTDSSFSNEPLSKTDPELFAALDLERQRQDTHLELIASENYTSPQVMEVCGSILTNKYAEGYPNRRYYGGCQHVDVIEQLAIDRLKDLFNAEYANVQPHSGSQANQAVMLASCKPGDTVLGMSLPAGGHLSHGTKVNVSGKFYNAVSYGLDPETEELDYEDLAKQAHEHKPKLIICGASAYSLPIDWQRIQDVADEVGARVLADIAHYAGLVATGHYPSPVGIADYITSTTHKSLRGPRGGIIMAKEKYTKKLNSAVFPGLQGGPLLPIVAGKAIAFKEAKSAAFNSYCVQILKNAKVLAEELSNLGLRIVSGRTESHVFLVDLTPMDIAGCDAEDALNKANITLNKNAIPNDPRPPMEASGIRVGTPALTSRNLVEEDCRFVANLIVKVLKNINDEAVIKEVASTVKEFCNNHPVYPN